MSMITIPTWATQLANNIDKQQYPSSPNMELFEIYLKNDPTWVSCFPTPETKQTFYLLVLESEGYSYMDIPND